VHFWRQFGLDRPCVVRDLQRLSSETKSRLSKKKAHLLLFKETYPILFECLEAVFGMMMSNSRLCVQIHGIMRFGLARSIGMDQTDAIQTYATSRDFEMKYERRCMALDAMEDCPHKKFQAVKYNQTKTQFHRMSEHMLEGCESFVEDSNKLLAEPNHGIPSVTEIKMAGRRVQDKENLKE